MGLEVIVRAGSRRAEDGNDSGESLSGDGEESSDGGKLGEHDGCGGAVFSCERLCELHEGGIR